MITPEHLYSWQPQAEERQLAAFIKENQTLMRLLEETWQRFCADNHKTIIQAFSVPTAKYAAGFTPDQLQHHPLTLEESARFNEYFHADRPFGNKPVIGDHDWELLD